VISTSSKRCFPGPWKQRTVNCGCWREYVVGREQQMVDGMRALFANVQHQACQAEYQFDLH
jgi:hypothetical protein